MRKTILLSFILWSFLGICQNEIRSGLLEYKFNPDKISCLTDLQRQNIFSQLQQSKKELQAKGLLKTSLQNNPPKFIWPVRKSATSPYENVWSISNHVDHNPNFPNQIQDWNCGDRTYDTADGYNHQGIDIFTWPFSWFQFQNNQAEIVAAADGIIIYKSDGNYDMNCSLSGGDWNAVYIGHSDGSMSWYGHMKKNSLTTKPTGSTVIAGEFLGIVGSSGNSTGPHLHFEVYNSANQLVETYQGPCNNLDSWWQEQKPYQDPKINAVLTHSAVPVFNNCPNTETTYLKNDFSSGNTVYGVVYLADLQPQTNIEIKLIRPNNTVASTSISSTIDTFYQASYWWWSFPAAQFNMNGTWKLSVTYLGKTVTHDFNYGVLKTEEVNTAKFNIYPNPAKDYITLQNPSSKNIKKTTIFDETGKMINSQTEKFERIDISNLVKGTYVLSIQTDENTYNKKFIKR